MSKPIEITEEDYTQHLEDLNLKADAKVLTECSKHPAIFAKYMLGVVPYTWQVKVMNSVASGRKRILINTSRQIGKTYMIAIIALWALIFNKGSSGTGMNTKIGIISRSDGQSKKLLQTIHELMKVGDAQLARFGKNYWHYFTGKIDPDKSAENNKTCITFVPGIYGSKIRSFIKSLPPTDAVLGETFDFVFRDEASRIEDDIHYRAISPTLDKFGKLDFVTSTPFGMSGFFYETANNDDESWTRFAFTIDAVKYDDPLQHEKKMKDIRQWRAEGKGLVIDQEYYCEFTSSDQSFFNGNEVDDVFSNKLSKLEFFNDDVDVGVDVGGQKTSHSVLTVTNLNKDGTILRVWDKVYGVQKDDELFEDILHLRNKFPKIRRVIIEKCQIADFLIRNLKRAGVNVEEFDPNNEKVNAYSSFRSAVHEGKVKSYEDNDLKTEMKALTIKQGVRNTMIHAPMGYTDDKIDSFVMACKFYVMQKDGMRVWDYESMTGRERMPNLGRNRRQTRRQA